ncbi:MAG: L-rhamnose mutarotase [Chitinophagaceae bacterium]
MKRYCLTLDLVDDASLIAEYEQYHTPGNVWPEITQSIRDGGITNMEIYRTGNRLFMVMETTDDFDPARKSAMDAGNEKVQQWERLMWKYQQPLPWAMAGEKWVEMKAIFTLNNDPGK